MALQTRYISNFLDALAHRIIKIRRYISKDIQTAYQVLPFGIDSIPLKDALAIFDSTESLNGRIIIGYINEKQKANEGETRLYAVDSHGNIVGEFWMKGDGTFEIGGSANHLTQYEALKVAFDKLKSDFNSHIHSSNGTPPTILSTADMSGAKTNNLKTA